MSTTETTATTLTEADVRAAYFADDAESHAGAHDLSPHDWIREMAEGAGNLTLAALLVDYEHGARLLERYHLVVRYVGTVPYAYADGKLTQHTIEGAASPTILVTADWVATSQAYSLVALFENAEQEAQP